MKDHRFSIQSPLLWQNWDYLAVIHFTQPVYIIDNFGPLHVKLNFDSNSDSEAPLHKVYVTLFTCALSRGVILDVVLRVGASSFIRSIKRFISRRGCPTYIISDGGRNFVSVETGISQSIWQWVEVQPTTFAMAGEFFERLVRSTKILLRKELGNLKLSYEQLQTVLLEIETILNNWPLTYYYADKN